MSCPRCGSPRLWDDNFWWGCEDCGFATNGTGSASGTMIFAQDKPGLPRSLEEVRKLEEWQRNKPIF
ncbi:hypothetical protein SB816_28270 [Achromobacter sp. SIMBA_011]|uniref:hypothetical protein n=1 Tax=Achromobacter sp. SIMBA_011 TaxID=3085759 RepID=UPI00397BF81C